MEGELYIAFKCTLELLQVLRVGVQPGDLVLILVGEELVVVLAPRPPLARSCRELVAVSAWRTRSTKLV